MGIFWKIKKNTIIRFFTQSILNKFYKQPDILSRAEYYTYLLSVNVSGFPFTCIQYISPGSYLPVSSKFLRVPIYLYPVNFSGFLSRSM